jgi:NADP-dependent 3-hydroxy acid dehydrogenase YdfG
MAILPVFIVTGASRGYGEAIVRVLLGPNSPFSTEPTNRSCVVVGCARSESRLRLLRNELGSSFHFVAGDVTDLMVIKSLVDKALLVGGRIDALVCNAG